MLGLHVVFAVDRAGLVGEDGETHHGVFDVGFLRQAPGMRILCPANREELMQMMDYAINQYQGPIAVRYPRGGDGVYTSVSANAVELCRDGNDVAIVCYGTLVNNALAAAERLHSFGIEARVVRLTEIAPLPTQSVLTAIGSASKIFVVEECAAASGICPALALELSALRDGLNIRSVDLGRHYVPHGAVPVLYDHFGLSGDAIANQIREVMTLES